MGHLNGVILATGEVSTFVLVQLLLVCTRGNVTVSYKSSSPPSEKKNNYA